MFKTEGPKSTKNVPYFDLKDSKKLFLQMHELIK